MAIDNCVQTGLDLLDSMYSRFPELESSQLGDLKVLLRFLRTFYMCGKKWGKGHRCESILLRIEETIREHAQKFQSPDLLLDHVQKWVSEFLNYIRQSFLPEMEQLYRIFSQTSLSSPHQEVVVQMVDIIDSLFQNFRDLLQNRDFGTDSTGPIEDLEEYVRFLKNFILFATSRGIEPRKMEDQLTHIPGFLLNAARFTLMSLSNDDYRKMWHNVYQLTEMIKPVEPHVCGIYVGILQEAWAMSESSSRHLTLESRRSTKVEEDFVDSLQFLLWQLLFFFSSSYSDVFNHQLQKLYEQLTFLKTILRENFSEETQVHTGALICEVGALICNLFPKENEGGLVEKFTELEEKFKLIRAEQGSLKFQPIPASIFPRTNVLGFIDSLTEKIASVSPHKADSSIAPLAKNTLQTLYDDLVLLRSFLLHLLEQHHQNGQLQALQSRITAIAYETEFFLDSLVHGDAPQRSVMLLNSITEEIKIIMAEASLSIHNRRPAAGITKTSSRTMPLTNKIPVYNAYESVVGMEDEARHVIARLLRGTKMLDVVSIVGMAGLGKTTLAKKVYRYISIRYHFPVHSWCLVSQVYNRRALLLQILGDLDELEAGNRHSDMNEQQLSLKLYSCLKGKRYLIVLDDVWDIAAWNSLGGSFPNDANGSRILLTSRSESVALQVKADSEPHRLRSLTDDESWELLRMNLVLEEGCPTEQIERLKTIASYCKGLPLMILAVAGTLSNMNWNTWEEVEESLKVGGFSSTTQGLMDTLELSYNHLPDYLKPCFLYLGTFKEHQEVHVRELIRLLIAEGFVETGERKSLEDTAESYLLDLIDRNLVMVAKRGSRNRVKSCILHDLLYDFCKVKCKEEQFLHISHGGDKLDTSSIEPSMLYRLCVEGGRVEEFAESRLICPRLRSFLVVADLERRNERDGYNLWSKLVQSRLLRVLDVRRITTGPFFPRVIESLVHLRYLALSVVIEGTKLTVPSTIGTLSYLMTFVVQASRPLCILLPDTVWNMEKLRHLCVIGASARWVFPKVNLEDTPSLHNLETLSMVEFSCDGTIEKLMKKFPNIRRLKYNLVRAGACIGHCCPILAPDFMSHLESLTIHSYHRGFHGLHFQFPMNLKKLVLKTFQLPWSKISAIDRLPNLEVLKLLDNAFTGEIWAVDEVAFPRLRFLKLADLDFAVWRIDSEDNFPCLEELVLEGCPHLEEVPYYIAECSLQKIEVYDCESAVGSIRQLEELQREIGNEDFEVLLHPSRLKDI
ncbi:OLC1v1038164C1 [Oldenlandia corymbosa var. corymbosa]|uniref:OLC1v1038164C1 n=1 Tax=Oldenlandia corymbosa var. corymbosa TaxID=529605 RepID=A0AAV1D298_OLDCO|nr:OLC1v1038164C1 [Oldenlandia corymbosa var. corymbosa]